MAVEAEIAVMEQQNAESPAKRKAISALDRLRQHTEIVVDSAKLADAQKATDATTNPSLILAAVTCGDYDALVKETIDAALKACAEDASEETKLQQMVDSLMIAFVTKILASVPGLVSFEVDAALSFDEEGTYQRAKALLAKFKAAGVDCSRLLVKIASTWEGIQAARRLEEEGVHCNLTLLFSFYQALACADAKAYLISPFVGRITDWYKAAAVLKDTKTGEPVPAAPTYTAENDPGVLAVKKIYTYFKKFDVTTVVMGASFRNVEQVKGLAGSDKLTIPPAIIQALDTDNSCTELAPALTVEAAKKDAEIERVPTVDEKTFRWQLNQDAMATEKLAEGIRNFNRDWAKLKAHLSDKYLPH